VDIARTWGCGVPGVVAHGRLFGVRAAAASGGAADLGGALISGDRRAAGGAGSMIRSAESGSGSAHGTGRPHSHRVRHSVRQDRTGRWCPLPTSTPSPVAATGH